MLVNRIHLNANEKDIYSYFVKAGVGKIRDVRLIRDQRSGKSKGYVRTQVKSNKRPRNKSDGSLICAADYDLGAIFYFYRWMDIFIY